MQVKLAAPPRKTSGEGFLFCLLLQKVNLHEVAPTEQVPSESAQ